MGRGWVCMVVVVIGVVVTPLHSAPAAADYDDDDVTVENNLKALAKQQVWEMMRREINQEVVETIMDMQMKGMVDVMTHTASLSDSSPYHFRVFSHSLPMARSALKKASIPYRVVTKDLAGFMEMKHRARMGGAAVRSDESCTEEACSSPLTQDYMSFEQMEWYLKQLADASPRVELKSIGKSFEGRDIWRVHISPPQKGKEKRSVCQEMAEKEDAIWLEGGIHAREWISPATAFNLIHALASEEDLTENLHIFSAPMANPDGYIFSKNKDRMWRKNRRVNEGSKCVGVDLNRNWDEAFGVGASSNPCSEVYKGTNAFSEPETKALSDEMKRVADEYNLRMVMALHSYGQTVLYPYGSDRDLPLNSPTMIKVGKKFANKIKKYSQKKYTVQNSGKDFYFASGATDDWAKSKLDSELAYTVELRGGEVNGFDLPPEEIEPTYQEVWRGLQAILAFIKKQD